MKRLYKARDLLEAQILKDYLAQYRIRTHIQGQFLAGAAGELPVDLYPELLIEDADLVERARDLIRQFQETKPTVALTNCPHCGVKVEQGFQLCWKCGRAYEDQDP